MLFRSAKDFAAAAKAEKLTPRDSELLARGAAIPDVGVEPAVEKAIFSLPVNGVTEPIQTRLGTAILRVVERHEVTPEEWAGAKANFRREVENERRGQFFNAYLTKAKQRMTIVVHDDALARATGEQ